MKNLIILNIILGLSSVTGSKLAAANGYILPNKVEVVTANNKPMLHVKYVSNLLSQKGTVLRIYNLDAVSVFKNTLNETLNLPSNEAEAKIITLDYVNKIGQKQFNQQLTKAYQGLLVTFTNQIDRYPAIIFDGNSIIYGVTDLKLAFQKYHNWQTQRLNRDGDRHE